jgi:threonine dehydratase
MRVLAGQTRLVVEPSGAVALAGLLRQHGGRALEAPVVAVVSGGNVALDRFAELVRGAV